MANSAPTTMPAASIDRQAAATPRHLPENSPPADSAFAPARAALRVVREHGTDRKERAFGGWLNRSRRVLLTLAAVWIVGIFDLGYTLAEWGTSDFVEANPVAAKVLSQSVRMAILFKFGLLGASSLILLLVRRHFIAELGCWFLFVTMMYVAIRWYCYFDCLLRDYVNPLIRAAG